MTSLVAKNMNNGSTDKKPKNFSNNKKSKSTKVKGCVKTYPNHDVNHVCVPYEVDTSSLKVSFRPDGITPFLITTEFEMKNGFRPFARSLIIENPVLFYEIQIFIGRIFFSTLSIYEFLKYNPESNEFLDINTRKKKEFAAKNPNLKFICPRQTILYENKKGKGHSMGKWTHNTYMNEGEGAGYNDLFFKVDIDPKYNTKDIFGEDITIMQHIQNVLDDTYGKGVFVFEIKYNVGPDGEKKDSVVCILHINLDKENL
jgi:hypothetical protein